MLRKVQSPKRLMRLEDFRVNGSSGTLSLVEGKYRVASAVRNGTGDYTLTFKDAFARVPTVSLSILTAVCIAQISSISTSVLHVLTFSVDGTTPKDADLMLHVVGADVVDQQ